MREWLRFGIETFVFMMDKEDDKAAVEAATKALPRRVRLEFVGMPGGFADPWVLLCRGDRVVDGNPAGLFAGEYRDRGRVLVSASGESLGSAVVHRDALQLGDRETLSHLIQPGMLEPVSSAGSLIGASPNPPIPLHRPAALLDRDGVLNVDHGHVGTRERFDWIPGALDAIRLLTESGRHVFVVTNQSGVARGFYDESAVQSLLAWMADEARRNGGTIDDARYCPHHPYAGSVPYRRVCACRKPEPGMLLDLMRAWDVRPDGSFMIGDKETDMAAARAARVPGYLFGGENLAEFVREVIAKEANKIASVWQTPQ